MKKILILAALITCLFAASPVQAKSNEVECRMKFTMKSWSFFYKSGKGSGTITCNNGQKERVHLTGEGGGITVGKSKIVNGLGVFSDVSGINELFGNYASGEAHVGIGGSASARVLTKGDVSLTLTGTGTGVDLGINFGNFNISKR